MRDQPMTKTYTRDELYGDLEHQARVMIERWRDEHEWSPYTQVTLSVFKTQWSAALTKDMVKAMGCALHNLSDWDPAKTLQAMVRGGLLRTRHSQGRKLYELSLS
jgi:hypothetical protein